MFRLRGEGTGPSRLEPDALRGARRASSSVSESLGWLRSTRRQMGPKGFRDRGAGPEGAAEVEAPPMSFVQVFAADAHCRDPKRLPSGARTHKLYVRALGSQSPWAWLGAPSPTPALGALFQCPGPHSTAGDRAPERAAGPVAARGRAGAAGGGGGRRRSGLSEAAGQRPDSGHHRKTGEPLGGAREPRERRGGR